MGIKIKTKIMSTNPLNENFTGTNVATVLFSALFKTFKESVELINGDKWKRDDAHNEFALNMTFVAPERFQMLFWNGNLDGKPPWKGMADYCQIFGTDNTRPLFEKISNHYIWRKFCLGEDAGFMREQMVT